MNKKLVAIFVTLTVFTGIISPVSAASTVNETLRSSENISYNEYDYIVEVRNAAKNETNTLNASQEEISYITSNAIENELLYRSTLPTDVLKDHYCYTDEAIAILREYNGERLETNPALRAVTSSLSASLDTLIVSSTRVGILYSWEWNSQPLLLFSDYAAVSWAGAYEDGENNELRFDRSSSFATVYYYYAGNQQEELDIDFGPVEPYQGAAISFNMEENMNAWQYWAKRGDMYIYLDLVDQSGIADLYEVAASAKYAHYTFTVGAGVSFPAGLSISFSGSFEEMGYDYLTARP